MKKLLLMLFSMLILTGCNSKPSENSENYQNSEVTTKAAATTSEVIGKSRKNRKYDFEVSDNSIKIISDSGLVQIINGNFSSLAGYSSPSDLINTEDYNFDGYTDIFVPTKFSEDSSEGIYYKFNSDIERFEIWQELNRIGHVFHFGENNTLVYSTKNVENNSYESFEHIWSDENLILCEHTVTFIDKESNSACTEVYSVDSDGNETLIETIKRDLNESPLDFN